MRERLTGKMVMFYAFFVMVFSALTVAPSEAQYVKNVKIEKLPTFTYQTLNGNKFSEKDLKTNQKLMIVYFNPLCEVCQKEVKEIVTNIEYFKDIQIVMVSPNKKEEIDEFANGFKLSNYPQITILHDIDDQFYKQFHAIGYPALYMYDENKVLLDHFDSHANIREIKNAFNTETARK
jgi:peroxiredoxin